MKWSKKEEAVMISYNERHREWKNHEEEITSVVNSEGLMSLILIIKVMTILLLNSVSVEDIGGHSQDIKALKEIVFFPLLFPQLYATFGIKPQRGVLLYGPPSTGKTLMVRALVSGASKKSGQKVSFYMRKGADVLRVGEAERQLKLLFEEAQKNRPSIIFFD